MNICLCMLPQPPTASRSPYTTLFRSRSPSSRRPPNAPTTAWSTRSSSPAAHTGFPTRFPAEPPAPRSEEHTSELQSRGHIVCRLLLEKKKYREDQRLKRGSDGHD